MKNKERGRGFVSRCPRRPLRLEPHGERHAQQKLQKEPVVVVPVAVHGLRVGHEQRKVASHHPVHLSQSHEEEQTRRDVGDARVV